MKEEQLLNGSEREVILKFRHLMLRHSLHHINEFFGLQCASDLLDLKIFPNAKEITESMAAYHCVRKYGRYDFKDEDVTLIAIADGVTPRTASLFAFRTKWDCYSIDPALKIKEEYNKIKRLTLIPQMAEDVNYNDIPFKSKIVIACVHSHAKVEDFYNKIKSSLKKDTRIFFLTIPCCVGQKVEKIIGNNEINSYTDLSLISIKNKIIWFKDFYMKER